MFEANGKCYDHSVDVSTIHLFIQYVTVQYYQSRAAMAVSIGTTDYTSGGVIAALVLLNVVTGTSNEWKAEKVCVNRGRGTPLSEMTMCSVDCCGSGKRRKSGSYCPATYKSEGTRRRGCDNTG